MYKLMIVDDETIIREGIENSVDFKALGIEIVGNCKNGIEALEVYKEHKPDMVITDINMPFMDGIELAEILIEMDPLIKIVVLTGYDRFDYVQQALKLKLFDYLLKPILPRDIRPVLTRMIQVISEERAKERDVNQLREQLSGVASNLRERFLNKLINQGFSNQELIDKLKLYDLDLYASYYSVMCIEDINNNGMSDEHDEALDHILYISNTQLNNKRYCICFRSYYDKVVVIVGADDMEETKELTELLALRIVEIVKVNYKFSIRIGIGGISQGLEAIRTSYKEAEVTLDYEAFHQISSIVSFTDIHVDNNAYFDSELFAADLYKAFRSGSLAIIEEILDSLFDALTHSSLSVEQVYIHIQNVVMSILLSIQNQKHSVFRIVGNEHPTVQLYSLNSLSDIETWLRMLCKNIMDHILSSREDYQISFGRRAIEYIDAHYGDQDLSLKTVCQVMSISVSYFSSIIKEATGKTFVDYLTCLRMDKAMEMLRDTDMKTYEIAEAVGFKDAHYFSLVFKKNMGITATEFRESTR